MKCVLLDIEYLKQTLPPTIEEEFYDFLSQLTTKEVTLFAMQEGSVAFPRYLFAFGLTCFCTVFYHSRVPLMRIEGPLIIVQLLETTLLTLVNYAR